jgi:hypothetical protein
MKRTNRLLYLLLIISLAFGIYSCDKEKLKPVAYLVDEPGYQNKDTILAVGDTIKVLIEYTWNGKHKIKNLEVTVNDKSVGAYVINDEQGQFSLSLIKGLDENETWDFKLIDDDGNYIIVTLNLTKDPNSLYNGITYFDSIILGAQSNVSINGFMSMSHLSYYTIDGAFRNQSDIDFFFYYDSNDKATMASPGADIPEEVFSGDQAPGNWSTRNVTLFHKIDITSIEFYGMYHDGYLIENFDPNLALKKAINLAVGDMYLFQMENGKKGLIYILSVDQEKDGKIDMAIKIQG